MRVLLDESLPRRLALELEEYETVSVQKRGWSGTKNGELLRKASLEFNVFVTGDQNLEHQQNQEALPISIIVLVAVNNRIETLRVLVPELLSTLQKIGPGELICVPAEKL